MSLRQLIKHLPGKHNQQLHNPHDATVVGAEPWRRKGSDYAIHYHGGKHKLTDIDPTLLQSRDSGYYGTGFYVSSNPAYSKSYGRAITKIKFKPDASVLEVGGLGPSKINPELLKAVQDAYMAKTYEVALPRGRVEKVKADEANIRAELATSTISWIGAVNLMANMHNYDIVRFSDGEVVVKNLDAIEIVK